MTIAPVNNSLDPVGQSHDAGIGFREAVSIVSAVHFRVSQDLMAGLAKPESTFNRGVAMCRETSFPFRDNASTVSRTPNSMPAKARAYLAKLPIGIAKVRAGMVCGHGRQR